MCFLICSVIFETFELYSVKTVFNFGQVSICLMCNDYSFTRGDIIGCLSFSCLLLHVYHYIGFQDVKQVWHQINVSLLKTAFVLLHATRNYFILLERWPSNVHLSVTGEETALFRSPGRQFSSNWYDSFMSKIVLQW